MAPLFLLLATWSLGALWFRIGCPAGRDEVAEKRAKTADIPSLSATKTMTPTELDGDSFGAWQEDVLFDDTSADESESISDGFDLAKPTKGMAARPKSPGPPRDDPKRTLTDVEGESFAELGDDVSTDDSEGDSLEDVLVDDTSADESEGINVPPPSKGPKKTKGMPARPRTLTDLEGESFAELGDDAPTDDSGGESLEELGRLGHDDVSEDYLLDGLVDDNTVDDSEGIVTPSKPEKPNGGGGGKTQSMPRKEGSFAEIWEDASMDDSEEDSEDDSEYDSEDDWLDDLEDDLEDDSEDEDDEIQSVGEEANGTNEKSQTGCVEDASCTG